MPVITSIKAQKNQKRVNIFLDGKFSFGLDLENFMKLHLKVEQELNEEQIKEIIKKAEFQKTLDNLLKFTTLRPRSEKEIKDYLKRKKVHESLNTELFSRLNRLDLVDDFKFAKWWVNQRVEFKKKSIKDISFELKQKGVDSRTIKNILDDSGIDEIKIVKEILEKKKYKWERYDNETKKQKITQYLLGKGFSWGIISKVVDISE